MNYYINLIQKLKSSKPELFVDSEKNNPFMEQLGGIAFARQPKSDKYVDLYGKTTNADASTNFFISKIINESYMETAREIAIVDPELGHLLEYKNANNEQLFANSYSYINKNYHGQLINSMERKMKILCARNSIEIKGIDASKEQQDLKMK